MALTRDDMLRELELLPVWRAKFVEPPVVAAPQISPEAMVQATAPVENTPSLAVPTEVAIPETPEIETAVTDFVVTESVVMPAEGIAIKTIGDSCVVCPLVALNQNLEKTAVNFILMGFSPNNSRINVAELFAGAQGELLNNMLAAIKFKLSVESFSPFNQIELAQPTVIIVLGEPAAQSLLLSDASLDELRGSVHRVQGNNIVVTYPPAHLLQHPKDKAKAWQDLLLSQKTLADLQS